MIHPFRISDTYRSICPTSTQHTLVCTHLPFAMSEVLLPAAWRNQNSRCMSINCSCHDYLGCTIHVPPYLYGIIDLSFRGLLMVCFTEHEIDHNLGDNGHLAISKRFNAIANGACRRDSRIQSVSFLGAVSHIGNEAFSCCRNLKRVEFPDSLTFIGEYAFSSCELYTLTIPGGVKVISRNAFSNCRLLQLVTIQDGVESIASQAFADCGRPLRINVPSSVMHIADDAFCCIQSIHPKSIPVEICASPNTTGHVWALKHPNTATAV